MAHFNTKMTSMLDATKVTIKLTTATTVYTAAKANLVTTQALSIFEIVHVLMLHT